MSVTDEELMAYVDGELPAHEAQRIAAVVSADPSLGARVDAEKRLRAMLRGHLDPVTDEPVPEELTLLIAAAAADQTEREMTDAAQPHTEGVVDLAAARAKRNLGAHLAHKAWSGQWRLGTAIAASLVLGLVIGTQLSGGGDVVDREGRLVASGSLAKDLDTRLASSQEGDLRIVTSFQRKDGDYCRVYAASASSGIACKEEGRWILERTVGGQSAQAGEYRQAGSAQQDLMAAAQDMAEGEPLSAAQEGAAVERGWKMR